MKAFSFVTSFVCSLFQRVKFVLIFYYIYLSHRRLKGIYPMNDFFFFVKGHVKIQLQNEKDNNLLVNDLAISSIAFVPDGLQIGPFYVGCCSNLQQ